MKLFIGLLLVATVALSGVLSLPARSEDAEVIGYPRRVFTRAEGDDNDDDFKDFKGVIDTGSGYPFLQPNPSVLNFGFFDSFDDLFRRFRARLWPVSIGGRAGEDSDEDSGSGGFGLTNNFDASKGNTTSTVKVVDGHKVEVNETVYGDEHSIFKVRVVNVRPLEEGETVEETVRTSGGDNDDATDKPVTSSPATKRTSDEEDDDEEEGRREPLAKKPNENEIQGNIDDPEHLSVTENIIEATTTTASDSNSKENNIDDEKMLPTTTEDLEFVTDSGLAAVHGVQAEEGLSDNGNGNNEFETNMSSSSSWYSMGNRGGALAADFGAEDVDGTAIENNEDTEEVNDNLNESSSTTEVDNDRDDDAANAANNNEQNEFEDLDKEDVANDDDDDDDDDAAVSAGEFAHTNVRHSNYAVIRNKEREDASSSDDEDADERAGAVVMHPTFNDEWGSYSENIDNGENNDLSNDIDVYDVEPIDLSNDIAVNDDANLPLNPDAEFIDVFGSKQTLRNMPMFEKLSLNAAAPASSDHLSSSGAFNGGGDMK